VGDLVGLTVGIEVGLAYKWWTVIVGVAGGGFWFDLCGLAGDVGRAEGGKIGICCCRVD